MERDEIEDVWDYFDKCLEDIGEKKAKCRICGNIYCYITTIHNLKQHLTKKHDIFLPVRKLQRQIKTEMKRQSIWEYFSKTDLDERRATCKICNKLCSYKTTTGNLGSHLKKLHPDMYFRMRSKSDAEDEIEEYEIVEEVETSSGEEAARGVWAYFERAGAGARCAVCRALVPRARADMRAHLSVHHPKLLPGQDSDQEADDDEHYTEVVYLEDTMLEEARDDARRPRGEALRPREKRRRLEYMLPKKPRLSPPQNQKEVKKKNAEDEEIESFGAYVTCLLKSLPKNVCTSVQRDIINIIMSAKFAKPESESPTLKSPNKILVIEDKRTSDDVQSSEDLAGYSIKVAVANEDKIVTSNV